MRCVALNVGLMDTDGYKNMHGVYGITVEQKRFEIWHVVITECVKLSGTTSGFF
jgi:hypothetical protein